MKLNDGDINESNTESFVFFQRWVLESIFEFNLIELQLINGHFSSVALSQQNGHILSFGLIVSVVDTETAMNPLLSKPPPDLCVTKNEEELIPVEGFHIQWLFGINVEVFDWVFRIKCVDEWHCTCWLFEVPFEFWCWEGTKDAAFSCFDYNQEIIVAIEVVVEVDFVQ